MPYTNVAKPTGASYTKVAKPTGATYTNVARPSQPRGVNIGMTWGLLIPLTINLNTRTNDPWTRIVKPT